MEYLTPERIEVHYVLPLAEIVFDFFDQLKSRTRGYASLDYEPYGYQEAKLVRVDVLLHGDPVDAFSSVVHRDKAYEYGRRMTERLQGADPAAAVRRRGAGLDRLEGSIARETVKAKRKDVLAKCYGGDITRKRKLLETQKKGKERMRRVGKVDVPQDAFIAALRVDDSAKAGRTQVTEDAGIYVHVPFCLTRCGYCDFNAYAGLDELQPRYLRALLAEAELAAPGWTGTRFVSVFLGGGTPTTMAPADLRALLVHLRDRFDVAEDAEVTIEANPDTVDAASLTAIRDAGYDRLSMGAQSFDPAVLASLERLHEPASVRRGDGRGAPSRLRQRQPRSHLRHRRRDARLVGANAARGDRARARARLRLRAHDRARDAARAAGRGRASCPRRIPTCRPTCSRRACELLRDAGYHHYEVSNWAKPGFECRHNLGYWERRPYVGLGAGAHAYRDDVRWWNVRPPETYLEQVEAGELPIGGERVARSRRRLSRGGLPQASDSRGRAGELVRARPVRGVRRERPAHRRGRAARPDRARHAPAQRTGAWPHGLTYGAAPPPVPSKRAPGTRMGAPHRVEPGSGACSSGVV